MLASEEMKPEEEDRMKFSMGAGYFKLDNFHLAMSYFSESASSADNVLQEKSLLLRGLSLAEEEKWEDAGDIFGKVDPESKYSSSAERCVELSRQGENLRFKNPRTAGLLAIAPGLGYLYDGYKQTALSSLIVNGLFFWGAYEAFSDGNQSVGSMLSVLSFGWYAGNIYGSVMSAQRRNLKMKNDLLRRFDVGFEF